MVFNLTKQFIADFSLAYCITRKVHLKSYQQISEK